MVTDKGQILKNDCTGILDTPQTVAICRQRINNNDCETQRDN